MGSIYLGGGGSEHEEANLWQEAFEPGQRIVVWPLAHRRVRDRQAAGRWMTLALAARGCCRVEVWTTGDSHRPKDLAGVDVIAIPGGNTFDLLRTLTDNDWFILLAEFVAGGGSVYGGSAGAIVLGADIAIASTADANDAGVKDTTGLDLLMGSVVLPHFDDMQERFAQQWAQDTGAPMLCLPERSGLVVSGGRARNVGPETVHVFKHDGRNSYPTGCQWVLTD